MPSPSLSAKLRTKVSYQVRWFQSADAGVVAATHEDAVREAVADGPLGDADGGPSGDPGGTALGPCGAVPHDATASDATRRRVSGGVGRGTCGSLVGPSDRPYPPDA
jgi:hypothetical protein